MITIEKIRYSPAEKINQQSNEILKKISYATEEFDIIQKNKFVGLFGLSKKEASLRLNKFDRLDSKKRTIKDVEMTLLLNSLKESSTINSKTREDLKLERWGIEILISKVHPDIFNGLFTKRESGETRFQKFTGKDF